MKPWPIGTPLGTPLGRAESEGARRPGSSAGAGLLVPLIGVLVLGGCGGQSGFHYSGLAILRLIEHDPAVVFRQNDLIESEPVFEWGRGTCLTDQGWSINLPDEEMTCFADAIRLKPSKQYVTFTLEVDIDADDVHAFDIDALGVARQKVGISWARENESFNKTRHVEGSIRTDPKGHAGSARLRVHGKQDWKGKIKTIRISLIVPRNGVARIEGLSAVRERVMKNRLEHAAKRFWKIELDDDLRNGVVGVPQHPIRWTFDLPNPSQLVFNIGILGSCRDGFVFEVRRVGDSSKDVLFEQQLDCASPGWNRASVPLRESGRHTLEFSTRPVGSFSPTVTLPVWANIEVLKPEPVEQPNIVLISVDTLRADHLSLYGYGRNTTPRLDEWCRRGAVVFDRAVAPSPWTLPSHTSIFTGLNAHRHGVNHGAGMPESMVTLAELLQEDGYATRAITAGGFVHQQYGFAQGFDVYTSMSMRMGFENELEVGLSRAQTALEELKNRKFFLFFHTYEVHNPFRARQPFLESLTGRVEDDLVDVEVLPPVPANGFRATRDLKLTTDDTQRQTTPEETRSLAVDLYDSSIAYTDEKLGHLFQSIEDLGFNGRTIVILTSDHGELFGEHDLVNHISLFDENVMVPLVFLDPSLGPGARRVSRMVRSVDLFSTILDLAGISVSTETDGRSLRDLIEGDPSPATGDNDAWSYAANSNYGISVRKSNGSTYIARNDAWISTGPREEFFGVPTEAQQGTTSDFRTQVESELADSQPGVRIRCRNNTDTAFSVHLRGSHVHPARVKLAEIGPGVLRQAGDGSAVVDIAPGQDHTFVIEGLYSETVHVSVAYHDRREFTHDLDIDPADLDGVLWLGWKEGAAVVEKTDSFEESGVYAWVQGERNEHRGPIDDEILEQLEALGYTH